MTGPDGTPDQLTEPNPDTNVFIGRAWLAGAVQACDPVRFAKSVAEQFSRTLPGFTDAEGAEKSIHAGQAMRWYTWRMPPIQSRRVTRK